MTEQIKSAVKELKEIPHHIGEDCDGYELRALHLAINSLRAWEEVIEELEEETEDLNFNYVMGIEKAIDIINQKLSEVEE